MLRPWLMLFASSALAIAASSFGDSPSSSKMSAGKDFFLTNVAAKLAENGCPMCHAVGYVEPNVMIYEHLLPYLAMGDSPEKTPVIRKIANLRAFRPDIPTHVGGPRCETLESEPCKSIIQWWQVEFGTQAKPGARK
jgi:hypothetical protein